MCRRRRRRRRRRRPTEIFKETTAATDTRVDDDYSLLLRRRPVNHCAACEFDMFASLITDIGGRRGDRNTHAGISVSRRRPPPFTVAYTTRRHRHTPISVSPV